MRKGDLFWLILMKFFLFEMCVYFLFVDQFPLFFISQRAAGLYIVVNITLGRKGAQSGIQVASAAVVT